MAKTKRIAVIGAGPSGITSAKACLEQNLSPIIFERSGYPGGLWRFQEVVNKDGTPSVMKSTIANTSKELSAFSDFPPPADFPNYMPHEKMLEYIESYSAKFNTDKLIYFNLEVIKVEPVDDYELNGCWRVVAIDLITSKIVDEIFDGVMVATGHHNLISYPKPYKGQNLYRGRVLHSHDLKDAKGFEDLEVVVVGLGNSGGDAAVELSLVARQVYLSTRNGSWVTSRLSTNGRPLDQYLLRRFLESLKKLSPEWLQNNSLEFYLNSTFNHQDYQLKPRHRVMEQQVMVNDLLPGRILCQKVAMRTDIDHFTKNGVVFKGESKETKCDAVIFATGYRIAFPFLSEEVIKVNNNYAPLYRYQFVPTLAHPETLAFIALMQSNGPLYPLGEMQARWFALLNSGQMKLPSVDKMERDIREKLRFTKKFYPSRRTANQADWLSLLDEIARDIGAMPPIWDYLLNDWTLFNALVFGTAVPYQYRLVGPNSWEGAREAILGVQDRIDAGLRTRRDDQAPESSTSFAKYLHATYYVFLVMAVFVTFLFWILIELFD